MTERKKPAGDAARATAITYDRERDLAPRIVAQGRGHLAQRIVELAREHGIPLHEDPDLSALLEALEVGSSLPANLYRAVAEVLCFVHRVSRQGVEPESP